VTIENRNLEPGTVLVARYKKQEYRAEVRAGEDGKVLIWWDGQSFKSLSAAGSAVMGGVACNGWRFWSLEGAEEAKPAKPGKVPKAPTVPKASTKPKGEAEPKARKAPETVKAKPKGKGKGKSEAKPKSKPKAEGKGEAKADPKPKKPIGCAECPKEFPTSREVAEHMKKEHNSPEAPGRNGW
jgi:hypothetical protein